MANRIPSTSAFETQLFEAPWTQRADSIIAYTADADIYCPDCARDYFMTIHGSNYAAVLLGAPLDQHGIPETIRDREGNEAGVVFAVSEPADSPEACCSCFQLIRD